MDRRRRRDDRENRKSKRIERSYNIIIARYDNENSIYSTYTYTYNYTYIPITIPIYLQLYLYTYNYTHSYYLYLYQFCEFWRFSPFHAPMIREENFNTTEKNADKSPCREKNLKQNDMSRL